MTVTPVPADDVRFTSVQFHNFKALRKFSVTLRHMNMLVGPNNSGKSTVLGAFRVLAAGLQRARARKPERIQMEGAQVLGYRILAEGIPISIENVHTDYEERESRVQFRLSSGRELVLHFAPDGECVMTCVPPARAPGDFRRMFPVAVGVVPVLGPLEHEEQLIQEEAVRRGLATHRASRHFRNYWWRYPEEFDGFAARVRETWPGMDIERPLQPDPLQPTLAMFCLEERVTRELFWAGFGFQVWCQILTHLVHERYATILIIDEPEIYLHPDLQRQLLSILRDAGPDILLATHSSELVAEAEPSDLLLVDKRQQSARRVGDVRGVQAALQSIGSIQNFSLTQLARTRRILYLEGNDFRLIRQFARRLGLRELAGGTELTVLPMGGFPTLERVRAVNHGIRESIGLTLSFAGIFDRDFRCDEEVAHIEAELRDDLEVVHIWRRKEMENYLLVPSVLDRATAKTAADNARRTGRIADRLEPALDILSRVTAPLRAAAEGQYLSRRAEFLRPRGQDDASTHRETIEAFEDQWADVGRRMEIVPGKETLSRLNAELQQQHGVTLTPTSIINEFRVEELPWELRQLLRRLDAFRRIAV